MSKISPSEVLAGILITSTLAGAGACAATTPAKQMPAAIHRQIEGLMNWMVPYVSPVRSRLIHPPVTDNWGVAIDTLSDVERGSRRLRAPQGTSPTFSFAGSNWSEGLQTFTQCLLDDLPSTRLRDLNVRGTVAGDPLRANGGLSTTDE